MVSLFWCLTFSLTHENSNNNNLVFAGEFELPETNSSRIDDSENSESLDDSENSESSRIDDLGSSSDERLYDEEKRNLRIKFN